MGLRVLVGNGDLELSDRIAACLSVFGVMVSTAEDGLQCLELVRRLSPHLVIVDRDVPWSGRAGVVSWLRDEGRLYTVSVIMTGAPAHRMRPECPDLVILLKPFQMADLMEAILQTSKNGSSMLIGTEDGRSPSTPYAVE